MFRYIKGIVIATLCYLLTFQVSFAQEYPNRPIRLLVPFGAGSGTDTAVRLIGDKLAQALGQPIVIENQPGANGIVASTTVAQAPPDGYTLLVGTNSTHCANPWLFKSLSYDPAKDFAPVSLILMTHYLLLINKDVPARSVAELVAYGRSNPGKLTYASGNGTGIVSGALFAQATGLELLHVPYKSTPQAMQDVIAGMEQFIFMDPTPSVPMVKAGKLVALAIDKRVPSLPDVPTFTEAGLPADFTFAPWTGIFAPAKTSPAIINRLNAAIGKVLADPDLRQRLAAQFVDAEASSPAALADLAAIEREKWGKAIKLAKIAVQ